MNKTNKKADLAMSDDQHSRVISESSVIQESFFPTTIFYRDLSDAEKINREVLPKIYSWASEDQDGIVRSNVSSVGSWHSQVDMHKREEYTQVVNEILSIAELIFKAKGYDQAYKPMIDNMWANINPRYGYNRSHTHPGSLWSGCYYVQTPPGSGRIVFSDPRPQAWVYSAVFNTDAKRIPSEWSEVYYEAIAGRMIIFPAWLLHEVEPNLSELNGPEGDRISIAFNISQYRK